MISQTQALALVQPQITEIRLGEVYDYWDRKRAGRAMPSRADIDPIDIPHLLANLILVDTADAFGAFRFRLFGSAVVQGIGEDRTGKYFSDLPTITGDPETADSYWCVYTDGQPDYASGRSVLPNATFRKYSRLLLPLSNDGTQVSMILGAIVFFLRTAPGDDHVIAD